MVIPYAIMAQLVAAECVVMKAFAPGMDVFHPQAPGRLAMPRVQAQTGGSRFTSLMTSVAPL